ncbi:MAG: ParB N-terminal domain-containing protein, partial [Chloroflexota bacterium]
MKNTQTTIEIEQVPIGELRPDPANPRRISDAELEALTRSIQEFGFVDPVIARREDRVVVGGHQRLLAARRLGYKMVPTVLVDLSIEQARLLNIALNKISGSWDQELLARLLADLNQAPAIDLTLSGFDDEEIKKLLKKLDVREKMARPESFDLEEALEAAQRAAVAQQGDVFLLGDHRLLCGDATNRDDVRRLLDGHKTAMVFTDPPYNVRYGESKNPKHKIREIENDWQSPAEWETFVKAFGAILKNSCEGDIYVWGASGPDG